MALPSDYQAKSGFCASVCSQAEPRAQIMILQTLDVPY